MSISVKSGIYLLDNVLNRLYADQTVSSSAKRLYLRLFILTIHDELLFSKKELIKYVGDEEHLKKYLEELKHYLKVKFKKDNQVRSAAYKFNCFGKILKISDSEIKSTARKIVNSYYAMSGYRCPNYGKELTIMTNILKNTDKEKVKFALNWCYRNRSDKMSNLCMFPYIMNDALKFYKSVEATEKKKHEIPIEKLKEYIVERKLNLYEAEQDYEDAIKKHDVTVDDEEFKKIKKKLGY